MPRSFFCFVLEKSRTQKQKDSPAHELDKLGRKRDPGLGVDDRRPRVADEVGRDDGVARDAEDAF